MTIHKSTNKIFDIPYQLRPMEYIVVFWTKEISLANNKRESNIMKRYFIPILVTLFLAGNLLALENPSQGWGELKYAHKAGNIRSEPSIDSELIGKLVVGQKVKVDFLQNQYYAIFNLDEQVRDKSRALGYVFAPILKIEKPSITEKKSKSPTITKTVYITKTGHKYHRGSCRYLKRSKISISLANAELRGLGPCSVCRPRG